MTQQEFDEKMELHAEWMLSGGSRAIFTGDDLVGIDLEGVNFIYARFENIDAYGISDFKKCNFRGVGFYGCRFHDAAFTNCDMRDTSFHRSKLIGSSFKECRLDGVEFEFCDLYGSQFINNAEATIDFKWCDTRNITGADIHVIDLGIHHRINYINGFVTIGCQRHRIEDWVKNYKEIGEEHLVNKDEIELYGQAFRFLLEKYKPTLDK
jgi:hypothetical protein